MRVAFNTSNLQVLFEKTIILQMGVANFGKMPRGTEHVKAQN